MKIKVMSPDQMSEAYGKLAGDAGEGKFRELIEKNAMDQEEIDALVRQNPVMVQRYPELDNIEDMKPEECSGLYKRLARDILDTPEDFETHVKTAGMTPEELSELFREIAGVVDDYPEIWESKESAQLLHPDNLSLLASALKEDTREAIAHIKANRK